MQRSELVVGAELYWARGSDWREGWGLWGRAVVLDTAPWSLGRLGYPPRPSPSGRGVRVRLRRHDDHPGNETVVNLNQLRGPYATTKAKVEQAAELRRQRQMLEVATEQVDAMERDALAGRAARLGVTVHHHAGQLYISATALTTLLDAYEGGGDG